MLSQPIARALVPALLLCAFGAFAQERKPSPDNKPSNLLTELPQIQVVQPFSAEDLIRDVFIGGDCFDVSNITFSGDPIQIGKFTGGATGVSIDEGIFLCTGTGQQILGPNNGSSNGSQINLFSNFSDNDLKTMVGQAAVTIRDRVVIEFDFRPTKNAVQFEYVFASEEYCEYVGSIYNDVFGFFISGPGISGPFAGGAQNIARVPTTNEYITINNVNHDKNDQFYVNNIKFGDVPNDSDCSGLTGVFNPRTNELQFDGLTTVLTTSAVNVQPCQTYHIRIALADIGDGLYNSAVFLKASSFNAGGNASMELLTPVSPTPGTGYEGCADATLTFTRLGQNTAAAETINFKVLPTSTATAGVDYSALPASVVIPAGQMSLTLPVQIFDDNLVEGTESVFLELENFCSCSKSTAELKIEDAAPLSVSLADQSLCASQNLTLQPTVAGGVGNLTWAWATGESTPTLSITPSGSTSYAVSVTDQCGTSASATATVSVVGAPVATLAGTAMICAGQAAELPISFAAGGPVWQVTYSFGGQNTTVTADQNPFSISVNQVGQYSLVSVFSNGCSGTATGAATVNESDFAVASTVSDVTCFGKNDGKIKLTASGGEAPYDYDWSNPAASGPNPTNLLPGNYAATVSDAGGCTAVLALEIEEPTAITITVEAIETVDCYDPEDGKIDVSASGGTSPLSYKWSNSAILPDISGLAAGNYALTVTDANGCTEKISAEVVGDFLPPTAKIQPPVTITCLQKESPLKSNGSSAGANFSYSWTTTDGAFGSSTNEASAMAEKAGTYVLTVLNTSNGCTNQASATVEEDLEKPRADAGADDEITCADEKAELDGTVGSSSGPDFEFFWTKSPSVQPVAQGSPTLEVLEPALYFLTVVDKTNGCEKSDSVRVIDRRNPPTAAFFEVGREKCAPTASLFIEKVDGGIAPFDFILDADQSLGQVGQIDGLLGGPHELSIIGANGCRLDTFFEVAPFVLPKVAVDPVFAQIRLGDSLFLRSSTNLFGTSIGSFSWSNSERLDCADCPNVWAKPFENTVFELILTDSAGCTASAQARIEVDKSYDVYVPNVFSPINLDGKNDRLTVYANPSVVTSVDLFEVFDRWGEKVFSAREVPVSDESFGWNGMANGKMVNPAVFVWFAQFTLLNGETGELKGSVTIVD